MGASTVSVHVVHEEGQQLVFWHEGACGRGFRKWHSAQPGYQDSQVWDALLHGGETSVWADKGYVNAKREAAFAGPDRFWGDLRKAPKGDALHPIEEDIKRVIAVVRARVEHPFHVLKPQFGYIKTRYRGLAKNSAQLYTLSALGNLFLVQRKLMA